jgi:hypothetical protein
VKGGSSKNQLRDLIAVVIIKSATAFVGRELAGI